MNKHANTKKTFHLGQSVNCQIEFRRLNMGASEPAFTCIKTKCAYNVQGWMKKGSDQTVLGNISKHPHL